MLRQSKRLDPIESASGNAALPSRVARACLSVSSSVDGLFRLLKFPSRNRRRTVRAEIVGSGREFLTSLEERVGSSFTRRRINRSDREHVFRLRPDPTFLQRRKAFARQRAIVLRGMPSRRLTCRSDSPSSSNADALPLTTTTFISVMHFTIQSIADVATARSRCCC